MKGDKVKKPIFKRWWFWLLAVVLVIAVLTPKNKTDKPDTEVPAAAEETVVEEATPAEKPLSFVLMDGEVGDYGVEVVLNEGSEFEEHEIAYYIPAGTYLVDNLNTKGSGQVTVYSGLPELDGEWESFVADENCAPPIVVMPGESKELEIKDGQFIVLSDEVSNFQFTLQ